MHIRHPELNEYPEINRLCNVAYRTNWTGDKSDEDIIAELTAEYPDIQPFLNAHYIAASDSGQIMAHAAVNPLRCYYHGNIVKLGGVGGVATYPEYRRGGAVKAIMTQALHDMYANGYVLSYLYPFNHAFYRKFGYESQPAKCRYSLRSDQLELRRPAPEGSWYMLTGQQDPAWDTYKSLYENFARSYSLMVTRTPDRWEGLQKKNPYKGQSFSYLFTSQDGKIKTAFSYDVEGDSKDIFHVRDISFTSYEGLEAAVEFIARHRSDYRTVILELPLNFPLASLIKDIPDIEVSYGMVRLVNVELALGGMPAPSVEEKTEIMINVTDDLLTANSGAYLLTIDDGETKILTEKLTAAEAAAAHVRVEAILSADIRELSLLACGSASFIEMAGLPQVSYGGNTKLLEALFPRRLVQIQDFF